MRCIPHNLSFILVFHVFSGAVELLFDTEETICFLKKKPPDRSSLHLFSLLLHPIRVLFALLASVPSDSLPSALFDFVFSIVP